MQSTPRAGEIKKLHTQENPSILNLKETTPVSYTHLDVYKRQVLVSTLRF